MTAEIAANTILLGKYRVEATLGRGGWGVVLRARHIGLDDLVAIKLLTAAEIDADSRARFVREARAAAKLRSQHVVRVTDVGETEDGKPYMIMELLEGCDVQELIKRGPVDPALIATLVVQVCSGLAEAHALGIVHRDIKSSNLFVTTRHGAPHAKVLDFGIAKAPQDIDFSLTRTSSILGTPAFMSPEQLRSAHRVDTRTDIWSLGIVLYEAVECRFPFIAENFSELVLKIGIDAPPPMANAPPGLEAIILRCLEKDPAKRYQTVGELADALAPWATGGASLIQSGPFARLASEPAIDTRTPVGMIAAPTIADRPRRTRWPLVLGAILGIGVGAVVFAMVRRGADSTNAGETGSAAVGASGSAAGSATATGSAAGSATATGSATTGTGSAAGSASAIGSVAGSGSAIATDSGSATGSATTNDSDASTGSAVGKPDLKRPRNPTTKPTGGSSKSGSGSGKPAGSGSAKPTCVDPYGSSQSC